MIPNDYFYNNLFGLGLTERFVDVFPDFTTFKSEYTASPLSKTNTLADEALEALYYLLYARYGDRHTFSTDTNQFKYGLFSTIFMYGPTWARRLDLQTMARDLTADDMRRGDTSNNTHAINPGTLSPDELNYINEQNKVVREHGKMEGIAMASALLTSDVSKSFLDKFASLFYRGPINLFPLYYTTEITNTGDEE